MTESLALNIPPALATDAGGFDFLSLGAMVHRLDPGVVPMRKAKECTIHISGGEYNVAANLADCFGLRTAIATAMVDHPLGDLVRQNIRAMGVQGIYKEFTHNGVDGPNIATVYSDRGQGIRPPVVFYNRSQEAAGLLKPGDFPWDQLLQGTRWLHSGGIFAALSESTPELIVEAMTAARAAGAVVSFDLNFRNLLWKKQGTREAAQATLRKIVGLVDVLVGNEEDLQQASTCRESTRVRALLPPLRRRLRARRREPCSVKYVFGIVVSFQKTAWHPRHFLCSLIFRSV